MAAGEPVVFEASWSALPPRARIAVVLLSAEAAARAHGITAEVPTIHHSWMTVEETPGGDVLVTADAFAALTGSPDPATPPGMLDAVAALLASPSEDLSARAFLARCNPEDVATALATVHDAVTRRTDLTPPIVLRQEFDRRRRSA